MQKEFYFLNKVDKLFKGSLQIDNWIVTYSTWRCDTGERGISSDGSYVVTLGNWSELAQTLDACYKKLRLADFEDIDVLEAGEFKVGICSYLEYCNLRGGRFLDLFAFLCKDTIAETFTVSLPQGLQFEPFSLTYNKIESTLTGTFKERVYTLHLAKTNASETNRLETFTDRGRVYPLYSAEISISEANFFRVCEYVVNMTIR